METMLKKTLLSILEKKKNDYLNNTDFDTELEYGKSEEYKQCVMPYIVDLRRINNWLWF